MMSWEKEKMIDYWECVKWKPKKKKKIVTWWWCGLIGEWSVVTINATLQLLNIYRFGVLGSSLLSVIQMIRFWSKLYNIWLLFECDKLIIRTFIKWCNLNHGLVLRVESGSYLILMSSKGFDCVDAVLWLEELLLCFSALWINKVFLLWKKKTFFKFK